MPWEVMTRALGLSDGGYVRSALDGLWATISGIDANTQGRHRAAFTIAFVSLAAKMAKADGIVAPIEQVTFSRLHTVAPNEEPTVRMVFDLAAGDTAGFEVYAGQIHDALADEPRLLRDVLDALFHIAAADGVFHGKEHEFLAEVARRFEISDAEFRSIRAAFIRDTGPGPSGDDPYEVLGVSRSTPDFDLKHHHRQLVRDHHPDSLMARGVPTEFHAAAERKLAVINAAYDKIVRDRANSLQPTSAIARAGGA